MLLPIADDSERLSVAAAATIKITAAPFVAVARRNSGVGKMLLVATAKTSDGRTNGQDGTAVADLSCDTATDIRSAVVNGEGVIIITIGISGMFSPNNNSVCWGKS